VQPVMHHEQEKSQDRMIRRSGTRLGEVPGSIPGQALFAKFSNYLEYNTPLLSMIRYIWCPKMRKQLIFFKYCYLLIEMFGSCWLPIETRTLFSKTASVEQERKLDVI